jgi:hypothetical protein
MSDSQNSEPEIHSKALEANRQFVDRFAGAIERLMPRLEKAFEGPINLADSFLKHPEQLTTFSGLMDALGQLRPSKKPVEEPVVLGDDEVLVGPAGFPKERSLKMKI